jgi:hypothetical protein
VEKSAKPDASMQKRSSLGAAFFYAKNPLKRGLKNEHEKKRPIE